MTRYQLVKLVALAGTLTSRKRVQKVVYLLQAGGCPLGADFQLHFYGPYSQQVAGLLNELVRQGLLVETCVTHPGGEQYTYALSPAGRESLEAYEKTAAGHLAAGALRPYEGRFRQLVGRDLGELELAATVAFHWERYHDWGRAVARAGVLKKVAADHPKMASALALARSVGQAG